MRRNTIIAALFILLLVTPLFSPLASAAGGEFALQVTPSPLIATLKPGIPTDLDLKIRNASTASENLKIEARSFKYSSATGEVALDDTLAPEIAPWVSFAAPTFTVKAGDWYTQKIHIALPKEAGFSYSFALVISRKDTAKSTVGGRLIKGSVAVFTLINVDRPGATRKLEVPKFVASKRLYEFLPATFEVTLKNTGNTIAQPYGNIFIQRGSNDKTPIDTIPVNPARSYILPDTTRTLATSWNSGFPAYKTTSAADGSPKTTLGWDWNHASSFRIGRYTAKLVAVYNDGAHDVPIQTEITFWVFPWRAIFTIVLALVAIVLCVRWYIKRRTDKAVRRALATHRRHDA